MSGVDVLELLRKIAAGEGDVELMAMRCHGAVSELIEAAKDAHYLGLMVGADCTWMLAKLQREGIYKPTCSDGKPSRADAGKDLDKIETCRKRLAAALAAVSPK